MHLSILLKLTLHASSNLNQYSLILKLNQLIKFPSYPLVQKDLILKTVKHIKMKQTKF